MANLINADPTNGLKLISDSSSEIQLQANGTTIATINSSGLSMNSGTLAGNGPAFSAYLSSNQAISSSTWTKVTFQTENFDTNSNYDNSTNYRFTPTVAGYYQINGCINPDAGGVPSRVSCSIYKNGSLDKYLFDTHARCGEAGGSALIYMNGSTDYVELYASVVATSPVLYGVNWATWFDGHLARAA